MRILVAGGTGAIGMALVPQLLNLGHEVTVLCKTRGKGVALRHHGARVKSLDALNRRALGAAVRDARPEVIINQLTSMRGAISLRKLDRDFAESNRLRIEATDTILAAALDVGTRRIVQQSFCGWTYARQGSPIKTEQDPLLSRPPRQFRKTLSAIRHMEEVLQGDSTVESVLLRYGFFYGPGTSFAGDGLITSAVRRRRLPIIGDGEGVWSFIHVTDAARATLTAATHGRPGIYNIVDDEPAPVGEWLPFLSDVLKAKPPRRIRPWLGRLAAGRGAVLMMTENRGASNAKARRELGWRPNYASWRQGFAWSLGAAS